MGICLRSNPQEGADIKGAAGYRPAERLLACGAAPEVRQRTVGLLAGGGWFMETGKSAGEILRSSSCARNTNVRVVSAYLDKVVSTYTDTKGRSRGRLFGSKSPIGDR